MYDFDPEKAAGHRRFFAPRDRVPTPPLVVFTTTPRRPRTPRWALDFRMDVFMTLLGLTTIILSTVKWFQDLLYSKIDDTVDELIHDHCPDPDFKKGFDR